MKPSTRRNFDEAAKEFEKIRSQAIAPYPATKRGRERLELLAYLHALASEFRCALEAYRELKLREPPTPAPPWLQPDAPIALLHEYRSKLLDIAGAAAGASTGYEETAGPPARLAHEPERGCGLVDACQDMAWFQDRYLLAEIFAEAADAAALPLEDHEEFIDETARAKMPEAQQNRTLARLKESASSDDTDAVEIGRCTKAVERSRKRLDAWLEESRDACKAAAAAGVKAVAENYPWAFANDDEPARILASAGDVDDPENRLRMKRWLTAQIVVNTAEAWTKDIRGAVFGDE
jgi:hypothetical protein